MERFALHPCHIMCPAFTYLHQLQSARVRSGFTLPEIMLALLISAILAFISISGLRDLFVTNSEAVYRNRLLQIIAFARESSQVLHRTVTICRSADLKTCGGEWGEGALVFVGEEIAGGRVLLAERFAAGGRLFVRFFPRYRDTIQFDPLAEVSNDNGTLWYCRSHASQPSFAIKINRMGVTSVKLPDHNGQINDKDGKPFACHQQSLA